MQVLDCKQVEVTLLTPHYPQVCAWFSVLENCHVVRVSIFEWPGTGLSKHYIHAAVVEHKGQSSQHDYLGQGQSATPARNSAKSAI